MQKVITINLNGNAYQLDESGYDVLREYHVVTALHACEVPVARAVTAGDATWPLGVPFAIFEFVDGVTVQSRERFDALTEAQRE